MDGWAGIHTYIRKEKGEKKKTKAVEGNVGMNEKV